ncbi:MAG: hypothetical protein JWM40_801 [Frankiales bacterium]|nr:hypothetical protein [Frankiales bacterium]
MPAVTVPLRWGERLERSAAGQALLSVLMLAVIAAVLLWNLPAGRPHDKVLPVVRPVVQAVGLEQDWALFAPDPRGFSVGVYADITFRDGTTKRWEPPHNGLLLAPYRTYRWQKYVERLRADDNAALWEPTARWIARQAGGDVVKVVLTRTFRDAAAPGDSRNRPATGTYAFYTLDLP